MATSSRHRIIPAAVTRVVLSSGWFVAGCAHVDPKPKIEQAMALVENRVGERPAWTAPWDDEAPPWDGASVLTSEQAVALALRNNRELRADLEMIGQADAELAQAGLLQNPVFNVMAMFPSGGGRAMLRGNGVPMQALQDLWLIPARKEVAQAQLQQAILRVADRAVEVAAEVKRTFARIRYSQRAIELTREGTAIIEQSIPLIQSRLAGGRATQVEVNVARIRGLRLRSELMSLEAECRTRKRELLALMGFPAGTDSWTVPPMHELDDQTEAPPDEDSLLAVCLEQRLDLRAALWNLSAADRQVALARRESWPDVALGLSFERAGAPRSQNPTIAGRAGNAATRALTGGEPMPPDFAPFGPAPRDMKWTVGPMVEFELPIFDQNRAQIARAIHLYRQRAAEWEATRQRVISKVRTSRVTYEQAVAQVRLFREEIIPEVDRNLRLVQQSYRGGTDQFTVFLQAQEDLINTRLSALAFLRDAEIERIELERQVGGRLPTDATHESIEDAPGVSTAIEPVTTGSSTGEEQP